MFRRFTDFFLAFAIALFYWLYSRLWRVGHVRQPVDLDSRHPRIYAHWHGDELLLIGAFTYLKMAVLVSRSRDGERLTRILNWFGYRVVRGSSSRGAVGGLKGLIDVVEREKCSASLAVDGPRGPIYKVKPGVLKLAQETGVPLLPGASAAKRRFLFKKAWNRCYLPLPFSPCVVVYGQPFVVPKELSDAEFENLRLKLEQTLFSLKVEAEAHFQRTPESANCSPFWPKSTVLN